MGKFRPTPTESRTSKPFFSFFACCGGRSRKNGVLLPDGSLRHASQTALAIDTDWNEKQVPPTDPNCGSLRSPTLSRSRSNVKRGNISPSIESSTWASNVYTTLEPIALSPQLAPSRRQSPESFNMPEEMITEMSNSPWLIVRSIAEDMVARTNSPFNMGREKSKGIHPPPLSGNEWLAATRVTKGSIDSQRPKISHSQSSSGESREQNWKYSHRYSTSSGRLKLRRTSTEPIPPKRRKMLSSMSKASVDDEISELQSIVESKREAAAEARYSRDHIPAIAPTMHVDAGSELLGEIGSAFTRSRNDTPLVYQTIDEMRPSTAPGNLRAPSLTARFSKGKPAHSGTFLISKPNLRLSSDADTRDSQAPDSPESPVDKCFSPTYNRKPHHAPRSSTMSRASTSRTRSSRHQSGMSMDTTSSRLSSATVESVFSTSAFPTAPTLSPLSPSESTWSLRAPPSKATVADARLRQTAAPLMPLPKAPILSRANSGEATRHAYALSPSTPNTPTAAKSFAMQRDEVPKLEVKVEKVRSSLVGMAI